MKKWLWMAVSGFLVIPLAFYLLNPFGTATWDPRARFLGITTYRIASVSMEPTLLKGDFVLVQASAYMSQDPAVGDVIVFRYPEDRSVPFVFRVIARSGDKVAIKNGTTYLNDLPVAEPYLDKSRVTQPYSLSMNEITVPKGDMFVLGDNRDNARDGRFWGTVSRMDVIGKVTYIWKSAQTKRIGPVH